MTTSNNVMVCIPCVSGQIGWDTAQGLLMSQALYRSCMFLPGCSEVNLARNLAVAKFLTTSFEWLVFIDADIGFSREDFEFLMSGDELAVYSPYSKKDGSGAASEFGLGFAKIHRSVFEKLIEMKAPESDDLAVNHFFWQNLIAYEFFPSFATVAHHWSGEDHSFWKLVKMAGVTPRREDRARLKHYGTVAFTLPAAPFVNEAANVE